MKSIIRFINENKLDNKISAKDVAYVKKAIGALRDNFNVRQMNSGNIEVIPTDNKNNIKFSLCYYPVGDGQHNYDKYIWRKITATGHPCIMFRDGKKAKDTEKYMFDSIKNAVARFIDYYTNSTDYATGKKEDSAKYGRRKTV